MVKPEIEDKNSLDNLLKTTNIPKQFELLSIDIDSYDLDVWENVKIYRPTVVVIEINSSIPPGIIWRNSRNTPGNTFSATIKVAQQKGYSLVCHTGNLIFIDNSVLKLLTIQDKFLENPELLFMYESEWTKFNPYAYNLTLIKRIKRRLPKWEKIFAIFTKLFSR
jgi:hypothetical protein